MLTLGRKWVFCILAQVLISNYNRRASRLLPQPDLADLVMPSLSHAHQAYCTIVDAKSKRGPIKKKNVKRERNS